MEIVRFFLRCIIWTAHGLAFVYFMGIMCFNILKQKDITSAEKTMQYFVINLALIAYALIVAFAF